jgi:choline dehydrogenase
MHPDVVIVGGGSAGCVLANRLSARPQRSVLLLEAGPDYPSLRDLPEDLVNSAYPPRTHDWGYTTAGERPVQVPRGKVIGGSSSTNYCFAARGRPADHDRWVELGNPGWSFEEILPC